MAYSKVLIALISSLISCVQINAAVINVHSQYLRRSQSVLLAICFVLYSFVTVSSSSTSSSVHLQFEYAACGGENFRIRKKIFAEKRISGYLWTWPQCFSSWKLGKVTDILGSNTYRVSGPNRGMNRRNCVHMRPTKVTHQVKFDTRR